MSRQNSDIESGAGDEEEDMDGLGDPFLAGPRALADSLRAPGEDVHSEFEGSRHSSSMGGVGEIPEDRMALTHNMQNIHEDEEDDEEEEVGSILGRADGSNSREEEEEEYGERRDEDGEDEYEEQESEMEEPSNTVNVTVSQERRGTSLTSKLAMCCGGCAAVATAMGLGFGLSYGRTRSNDANRASANRDTDDFADLFPTVSPKPNDDDFINTRFPTPNNFPPNDPTGFFNTPTLPPLYSWQTFKQSPSPSPATPTISPNPSTKPTPAPTPTAPTTPSPTPPPATTPTQPPSPAPTPPPVPLPIRQQVLQQMFNLLGVSDPQTYDFTNFLNLETPQQKALNYIANIDTNLLDQDTLFARVAQRYSLMTMFYSMDGAAWTAKPNWMTSADECQWEGITCTNMLVSPDTLQTATSNTNRNLNDNEPVMAPMITKLKLQKSNLAGPIPTEIQSFKHLQELHLYQNNLSGRITQNLYNLTNLERLYLDDNDLRGFLAPDIGKLTKLRDISLYGNKFSGPLPSEMGKLTNLTRIWANGMFLSGQLPSELGQLKQLKSLYLEDNVFKTTLPSELGNLETLRDLRLHGNVISGDIPATFSNLKNLEIVYIDTCELRGGLTDDVVGAWTKLRDFQAYGNNFGGQLSNAFADLENLEVLNMANNKLVGNVPPDLGQTGSLLSLDLRGNTLSGPIPDGLEKSTNILNIDLSQNDPNKDSTSGIDLQIPEYMGTLSKLRFLRLNQNRLVGNIPNNLADIQSLVKLQLSDNFLRGPMPPAFCDTNTPQNTRNKLKNLTADCAGTPQEVECTCCTLCTPIATPVAVSAKENT